MASIGAKVEAAKAKKQHVFQGERVQAFSDAVFAIVATFAVIPLKLSRANVVQSEGGFRHFSLENFFKDQWPRYFIYLYSFALIVDVWICHVSIFGLAEQVNDGVLWLNLVCLLLVTFLPFSTGLVSSFPDNSKDIEGEQTAISIAAGDIAAIGLSLIILAFYIFRRQALVHPEIANNPHRRSLKWLALLFLSISPLLALLALGFSFLTTSPVIGLVLFYMILVVSAISKIVFYILLKIKGVIAKSKMQLTFRMNKLRMEAFSDGVFSIAATLIVLDLTTEYIPSKESLHSQHDGNLVDALHKERHVFLAYFTSFVVIGLLWFVQYSMFHFVKKMTNPLTFINLLSLFLVGLIPFVSGVNSIFSEDITGNDIIGPNKKDALRAFSVVMFLVGVSQTLFWTVALFQKRVCLTDEVDYCSSETLQFIKTMVFPIASLIIYWGTFSDTFMFYHVYNYFLFAAPFVLLALKGFFVLHARFKGAVKGGIATIKNKGQNDQSTNEDAPLVTDRGSPTHHQGGSSDIELSPSSSPQTGSPVHVQFSPNDHEYHAMGANKMKNDS